MSLVIDLLVLAIIIPGLALFGHLYVAYRFAPERAKRAILDALTGDQDFQNDLMKSILNNLFKEVRDGEKTVIPIDAMISRAKASFQEWIKAELPKADPGIEMMMQPTQDEYGNPVQPDIMTNIILSQVPKKYRGYVALAMKYLK
jgi:hypothetical protein